jgi:antitoxin component YwqK of YwqJK toxin-antitoxin module
MNLVKYAVALAGMFVLSLSAHAQNSGTIYYLKNSGKSAATKDSADYYMVVLPPDPGVNKKLYIVYEYYRDGKARLITNSKTKDINLLYQGRYIAYYPNGKKRKMGTYEKGTVVGRELNYFPDGKLSNSRNYSPDGKVRYDECRDSTGAVLAEHGSGKWTEFNEHVTVIAEGQISDGVEDGTWRVMKNDSLTVENIYDKGKLITSEDIYKSGERVYEKAEIAPVFRGGEVALGEFFSEKFIFPLGLRYRSLSGTIDIIFTVEKDGKISNLKIKGKVGYGFDENAFRIMKESPNWIPGTVHGVPVRALVIQPFSITTKTSGEGRRF